MAVDSMLQLGLGVVFCAGVWLTFQSYRALSRRARALELWPQRTDVPETPKYGWIVYPQWSLKLLREVLGGTSEHDERYLSHRRRLRVGVGLIAASLLTLVIAAQLT